MSTAPAAVTPDAATSSPLETACFGNGSAPIVSIHDVMPETLEHVGAIVKWLAANSDVRPILLVVPGRNWRTAQLAQLRAWSDAGITLAGHGWTHEAPRPSTLYHRVHSAVLSRNVAEHLALDAPAISELLHRNFHWFKEQFLPDPELYVPPAWAMGAISRAELARAPFRYYETLAGIYDVPQKRFRTLPLAGFEADTPLRALTLRAVNRINQAAASQWKRPLRIAIHPFDFEYRLKNDLESIPVSL